MIIKPTRDQPSRPTPVRTPTTQIGTPALPLWSLVFCFVFPFRSFMFLLRTQSSVLCVHTQCRSVSSIYLRVDGLAHGNTGTLQCVLLHTKVRALVEWHRDHEVTQHQSEIIQKMHTGSQGQLKARKWNKIYPQHHNKQYVERSKCFTLTKDEQTAKTNTQCQDIRAHTASNAQHNSDYTLLPLSLRGFGKHCGLFHSSHTSCVSLYVKCGTQQTKRLP